MVRGKDHLIQVRGVVNFRRLTSAESGHSMIPPPESTTISLELLRGSGSWTRPPASQAQHRAVLPDELVFFDIAQEQQGLV